MVPLYSVRDDGGNYRPQSRLKPFSRRRPTQTPHFFYLPEDATYSMNKSLARLERIQFVREPHLLPMPVVLTDRAVDLLRQWSANYYGMDVCLSGALLSNTWRPRPRSLQRGWGGSRMLEERPPFRRTLFTPQRRPRCPRNSGTATAL